MGWMCAMLKDMTQSGSNNDPWGYPRVAIHWPQPADQVKWIL